MDQSAHASYLEAQVLTATPQKLRLMLIEATISAARQTLKHWEDQRNEEAMETLARCRSLLSELLSGVKPDNTELTRNVAGVYLFLFKTLTEAQLHQDPSLVESTIEVLQVERETWRKVCEQMPNAPLAARTTQESHAEITASSAAIPDATNPPPTTGGLVLDA